MADNNEYLGHEGYALMGAALLCWCHFVRNCAMLVEVSSQSVVRFAVAFRLGTSVEGYQEQIQGTNEVPSEAT
jgi:hypothetical protein